MNRLDLTKQGKELSAWQQQFKTVKTQLCAGLTKETQCR